MWHRREMMLAPLLLTAAAPASSLGKLMQRLAAVSESRARFVEEKTIAALTQKLRSEGWLVYRRPDHLEKVTTGPVPESLMVDGDRLSVVTDGQPPRLIDLAAEPALGALVDAVRGTLTGDLAALRRSYAVAMQGDATAWRLILTPAGQPITELLREVTVDGAGVALRSVRTVQANGDVSLMTISPTS